MQAQGTRTEAATTSSQSLVVIQTLLKASLGCISFLRDLLPSDNFTDSYFTSSSDDSLLSQSSDANHSVDSTRSKGRNSTGFKIMSILFDETVQLKNHGQEYGIFDALQKRIVEAYTFNFHYHKVPGTDAVVPVMSLGENTKQSAKDPVTQAAKSGKAPTLKDVKKSVKRRFAAFKLFYTDETPAEYEPPHFQAGDAQKDKWYFMTHDMEEVPDNWKMGRVDTGHHAFGFTSFAASIFLTFDNSVNLSVASIATYLPSSTEDDHATFTGTTTRTAVPPTLTPVEEASVRAEQAAKQLADADSRNIVWSADTAVEGDDIDADGEDDEGNYGNEIWNTDGTSRTEDGLVPIGIRNEEGSIEPLSIDVEEAHFGGVSQNVPTRLYDLNAQKKLDNSDIEKTQSLPDPFGAGQDSRPSSRNESLPPSDLPSSSTIADRGDVDAQIDIDTQRLQHLALDNAISEDSEMLDMETQVSPAESVDPIQSFEDTAMDDRIEEDAPTPKPVQKKKKNVEDRGLQCECDVVIEDQMCFCEDCGRWYHICFHSTKDGRIPEEFVCFDCRLRADNSWELIKVDLYPKMLSKFKDLALFRRAIKVVETYNPQIVADFGKIVGKLRQYPRSTALQTIGERRSFHFVALRSLKVSDSSTTPGFIVELTLEMDDLGFVEPRSKAKGKSKGKQAKQRKNVQKSKYTFNRACLLTAQYTDYFERSIESRLLDLPQKKAAVKARPDAPVPVGDTLSFPPMATVEGTQTQEETQLMDVPPQMALASVLSKRRSSNDGTRPKKKVKVSIAPAVDLAE
ncbi:HORMA domain-containing protein [Mycena pura]|uniref:HORMA domain-containing protein n=1 Tax=Mycena pura TaxID=153505 RepID=A0AAD6YEH8_9AGAR|nr:HORMA domain-containing protein [Mycena pura]